MKTKMIGLKKYVILKMKNRNNLIYQKTNKNNLNLQNVIK